MRQALTAVRLSTADRELHEKVMFSTARLLSSFDLSLSPPENAVALYGLVAQITGERDPFYALKKQSNDFALTLYDDILLKVQRANDPLHAAFRFAAAGNIIDYGSQENFDIEQKLLAFLTRIFHVDDFSAFQKKVNSSLKPHVLYLADNCGEIVFDKILVEQLLQSGCKVTLAVRDSPVINDATMVDANYVGMDSLCRVIVNGTACPGTPLSDCTSEFKEIFSAADIVLSKGQGNFETLSEVEAPIFFLLTVKCSVVARHIVEKRGLDHGAIKGEGELIMMQAGRSNSGVK